MQGVEDALIPSDGSPVKRQKGNPTEGTAREPAEQPEEEVATDTKADIAEEVESANVGMEVEVLSEPAINAVSMFGALTGQHLLTSLKGNTCAEREGKSGICSMWTVF